MKYLPFFLCLFTLAGCQQKVETCWSPETKKSISDLSREILENTVGEYVKAGMEAPKILSAEQKAFITKASNVSISNLHVKSVDKDTGNLECGGSVNFAYTTKNNKTFTADRTIITFHVVKSEEGQSVLAKPVEFNQIVEDVNRKVNADAEKSTQ